jgi:hypothetical protein
MFALAVPGRLPHEAENPDLHGGMISSNYEVFP